MAKDNHKISIIIPAYNVGQYLAQCVDSMLAQTWKDIEVILVDDCSTDSTAQICDEYEKKDGRIRVVHKKKRGGLSGARNCGIELATGSYIAFVDGDDFISPDLYKILMEGMQKNGAMIGICSYLDYYEGQKIESERRQASKENVMSGKEAISLTYAGEAKVDMIIICNKLYNKKLFLENRFPLGRLSEDEYMTYKLLYSAPKVYYTKKKMYYYRQRENSITHTQNRKRYTDYLDALIERQKYFECMGDEAMILKDTKACMAQLYSMHALPKYSIMEKAIYHKCFKDLYKIYYSKLKASNGRRENGKYFIACHLPYVLYVWSKLKG